MCDAKSIESEHGNVTHTMIFVPSHHPSFILLCTAHINISSALNHCGDTCERNLHFQLNCRPSL